MQRIEYAVFPAYAGLNREKGRSEKMKKSVPRIRGAEPGIR